MDESAVTLADVLFGTNGQRRHHTGVVATAIDEVGILGWDRFGRKAGPRDHGVIGEALDHVAAIHKFELDHAFSPDYGLEMTTAEAEWSDYDSPLRLFYWPRDAVPDFDAIAQGLEVQERPVHGKRQTTYQRLIAALLNELGIVPGERSAITKVEAITQSAEDQIDRGIISGLLGEVAKTRDKRARNKNIRKKG